MIILIMNEASVLSFNLNSISKGPKTQRQNVPNTPWNVMSLCIRYMCLLKPLLLTLKMSI